MFAIALAVSFDDSVSPTGCLNDLLDAWPGFAADGRAVASAPGAAAGILRWAVVDRDRRVVPIWDSERQLLFVGDVRLYNRNELGRDLDLGQTITDLSDADLAWRAYQRWGEDAARHLVGDFAFAVWDQSRRAIFVTRDHLGIRPLYYVKTNRGACVASDVRQLLAVTPRAATQINAQVLLERFARGRRTSGQTFFRNIAALPGGHVATIAPAACRVRQYWIPSFDTKRRLDVDDRAEICFLFRRAVRDRLESDNPIVAHLSGGFDSSAIVLMAEDIYADGPGRPPLAMATALTPGMPCDDVQYVDVIARQVRFESVRWNALETNLADIEDPVVAYPGLRRGIGGGFRRDLDLLRERNGRVLLHGYFGDGLTHSFDVSRDMLRAGSWQALARHVLECKGRRARTRALLRSMMGVLPPPLALRALNRVDGRSSLRAPRWMGPALRALYPPRPEQIALPEIDWPSHVACELWSRLTSPRTGAVIDTIVGTSAEAGIEVRLPYLDLRLAEKVLSLPWQDRTLHGEGHRLVGQTFRSLLPEEFARRRRGSWTDVWVRAAKPMLPGVWRLLTDGIWLSAPYVDNDEARTMFHDVNARSETDPLKLFRVCSFGIIEAWLRRVFRYDASRKEPTCPMS
jgi:asparagine synthase (glutamine-hydrolysing)